MRRLRAVGEILEAIRQHGTIEAGTNLWVHYGYRAWMALTEHEKELFRKRFPDKPDPKCRCELCEEA